MPEVKGVLLPAYVLVDESRSMEPYAQALSQGLISLCERLRAEPMVAAKLRLAILGFSDDVQVRLAVADMRAETTVPQVKIRGLTNYGPAFGDLLNRIPTDVRWLHGEGYKVHRPVVFFFSDGQPTDGGNWRDPHSRLTNRAGMPAAPNIIACGIGEAQAQTLLEVATRPEFAFIAKPGTEIGSAIAEFFHALTTSLVTSARGLASDTPQLVVTRPDQFALVLDEVGRQS